MEIKHEQNIQDKISDLQVSIHDMVLYLEKEIFLSDTCDINDIRVAHARLSDLVDMAQSAQKELIPINNDIVLEYERFVFLSQNKNKPIECRACYNFVDNQGDLCQFCSEKVI